MGPLWVDADMKLHRRNHTWADDYSMLFIDQPVGTGYSYVTHKGETDEQLLKQIKTVLEREQDQESASLAFTSAGGPHHQQRSMMSYTRDGGGPFLGAETSSRQGGVGPMYFHGYTKDERGVAKDLMVFLHGFFRRYPEQRKSDLYLAGESYAGKYVPAFAEAIVLYNEEQKNWAEKQQKQKKKRQEQQSRPFHTPDLPTQIRLRGIALGNSLTDPLSQEQVHADMGFYLGYLDEEQREMIRRVEQQTIEAAEQARFLDSNKYRNHMFALFRNFTGGINVYDVRKGMVQNDWGLMDKFLNLEHVKDSLNVAGPRTAFLRRTLQCKEDEVLAVVQLRNATQFFKDPIVREAMASDIMRTSAPVVGRLLDQYGIRVLAFQGVFDFRDGVSGSHYWVDHVPWYGRELFLKQKRKLWRLEMGAYAGGSKQPNLGGGEDEQKPPVVGYVTQYNHLAKVAVLGAGHLAPMDQGYVMKQLIQSFVEAEELTTEVIHQELLP
ncbi:hypothetical protein BGZ73_008614 [Actinomortierella ambigua]|nr:hypothetical protein BGZ73_008614 [Actinomortierella ambigua]